jgi:integrase
MDRYRHICTEHGVGMANKSVRILSSIFNYARAIHPSLEDWANPIRVLTETKVKRQLRPRTTFLPQDRLHGWLNSLDDYRDQTPPQQERERRADVWLLLHLLLMTGMRSNEGRSLRWSDVDLDKRTVTVREEIAKNHREAELPLNDWLVDQMQARKPFASQYIFQARSRTGYIDNIRRPLAELQRRSGMRILPHDLRRTYATYLDSVGTPFGVIKQLLNHTSGGDVTAQYVQRREMKELRHYANLVLGLVRSEGKLGR